MTDLLSEMKPKTGKAEAGLSEDDRTKLNVLWQEHLQREKAQQGPGQVVYRCLEMVPSEKDATLLVRCGQQVTAGHPDVRARTGETVVCPNHGGRLTPMEPIW